MNLIRTSRTFFLCISILLCHLDGTFAQETLTLDECLSRVRSANPDSRQLALSSAQLDLQERINRLNYFPQLSLNAKATWQSDVTSVPLELPGFEIPKPDQDQYAATLDLSQSIYDGGTTHARREVFKQDATVSRLQHVSGIQTTEDLATDLYYQIAMQQQLINTTGLLINQLTNTINALEEQLASGTITKKDVFAARVKLKEAEQKQQEATYYKSMIMSSLAILMGEDEIDYQIELAPEISNSTHSGTFADRAEMQLLEARTTLLEVTEQLNKAQYHPRVSAFASLGYGKPGLNFLSDDFDTYALVGVNLSIPLSQVYNRKSNNESQLFQLQKESLRLSREKLVRDLSVKEQQRLAEIAKLESWLAEDDLIISMRKEMLEVSMAQHEGGTITTTDYLNEIQELSLAEERRVIHDVLLQREKALLLNLYGTRTPITD